MGSDTTAVVCDIAVTVAPFEHLGRYHSLVVIRPVGKFISLLFSLHMRSVWETICDAQAGFWLNSKFLSKFSRKPLSGISDQKAPPPHSPISENFRFEMTKVYSGIPPPPFQKTSDLRWPKFTPEYPPSHFGKVQIWDDQSLLWNTPSPHFGKLQIWDDQSLLRNTPPLLEKFRFEMTKVYSGIPPPLRKMQEIVCGD